MALRVARGLFRLWLVLSVLWIGMVAIVTCSTTPVSKFDWEKNEQRRAAIETIWLGSVIAFVPPAFVLAVGSAMAWAVRRFR
jgi:ABC-type sulfate transport system permease component